MSNKVVMRILLRIILPHCFMTWLVQQRDRVYSNWIGASFGRCKGNIRIQYPAAIKGGEYIEVGDLFGSLPGLRIECWDQYCGISYSPKLIIGRNVSVNRSLHIGCCNLIVIGDDVLIGSNVCITDHQHGYVDDRDVDVAPSTRDLYSKGAVVIGDGVWIGENVVIMPNVTIGKGAIIGAGSIVTKNIPDYGVAVGCPARTIRKLKGVTRVDVAH